MKTVVTQFLEQARKYPDNPAVLDISGTYTYERLNLRSAYLAERILENIGGKGQHGRIALFLPRTKEFMVALFAVLRAGCAAVPIDGDYPRERVCTILEDVGCGAVHYDSRQGGGRGRNAEDDPGGSLPRRRG